MESQIEPWVESALGGDKDAFCALVSKYQHAVYGLAFHYLKNSADAEDIAQEVFLAAYQQLGTLRHPEKFASWLNGITVNLCKMWFRRQRETVSIDGMQEQEAHHLFENARVSTPDEVCERQELHERVQKAIAQLPEPNRIVFTLRSINGLSYEEISDFLNVPLGTIKSRLHRAKQILKKELADMVAQNFKEHQLSPGFTEKLVSLLASQQDEIIEEWSADMAVIDAARSKEGHKRAISAFLSSMLEHLKDDSKAEDYYECVETLAQAYNVGHLAPQEVIEMIVLLQAIFTDVVEGPRDEKWAIQNRFAKVVTSSCVGESGWVKGAAGRFPVEETASAIKLGPAATSSVQVVWSKIVDGKEVGGNHAGREQAEKNKYPGYMICRYINCPSDLIQKPVRIGHNWTQQDLDVVNLKGHTCQTTVESLSETVSTPAGRFSNCLKLKTVITGEGIDKDGKQTPEIDVFVRGTRQIWLAPGVGLVKLQYHHEEGSTTEANLVSDSVAPARNSYLPLAVGNLWRYQWTHTDFHYVNDEVWRVASKSGGTYKIRCLKGVSHFPTE